MKKNKILGLSTLALVGILGVTGCSVSEKDGKAWAEANGYIKYEDTYTNSSIKPSSYAGLYEEGDKLVAAMASYHGQYLHITTNLDGSQNVAFFIFGLKKNAETNKYEITQTFGVNEDGTPNQTVSNLLRTGKGTAVYSSHGYGEIVADSNYVALTGASAPTFVASKYYSYNSTTQRYTALKTQPADWDTAYTNYFVIEYSNAEKVDLKLDADHNVGVMAQMNYVVKNHEEIKTGNTVTGHRFVLEVQSFGKIS